MSESAVIGNVSALDTITGPATVNDPTANLWACLDPAADRLRAAHALTGVDLPALVQLGAAEAVTQPVVRQRLEHGPFDADLASLVAGSEPMLGALPRWAYDNETLRDAREQVSKAQVLITDAGSSVAAIEPDYRALAPTIKAVLTLIDQRTRLQHEILLGVVALAVQAGICEQTADGVPRLAPTETGDLVCEAIPQLTFCHPGSRGSTKGRCGIRVGHILLDAPDYRHQPRGDAWQSLRKRATSSRPIVVFESAELATHHDELIAEMRQSASSS